MSSLLLQLSRVYVQLATQVSILKLNGKIILYSFVLYSHTPLCTFMSLGHKKKIYPYKSPLYMKYN